MMPRDEFMKVINAIRQEYESPLAESLRRQLATKDIMSRVSEERYQRIEMMADDPRDFETLEDGYIYFVSWQPSRKSFDGGKKLVRRLL